MNAASRALDRQVTVRHQALQASCTYTAYRGPCPVHLEGTYTWGNFFQNPRSQGGQVGRMAGRHNGRGRSGFSGCGHFGVCGGGSSGNPTESYHANTVPTPLDHFVC